MSDKREDQPKEEKKPWEKTFNDDQDLDQEGNLSRTKHRKQTTHNSMITTSLIVIIIVLAATPVVYWIDHQSSFNKPDSGTEAVAQSSSSHKKVTSTSKSEKTSVKSTSTKKASKSKSSSSSVAKESTSAKASSSSASSSSSSSSSSSDGDKKYVTVPAGEGLYRVAVNNGITVQELCELNGISSSTSLTPGQQLRVK